MSKTLGRKLRNTHKILIWITEGKINVEGLGLGGRLTPKCGYKAE
jgi:hypothetical protein